MAQQWFFLVAALLSATSASSEESRPTKQPPTRGQDFQRCAWAALPSVINLAPVSSSWFSRTGKWSGKQGAELVRWEQNRFRIDYTNLDFYVDQKPWFHAKVLRNEELELDQMRIWLPPVNKKQSHETTTTVVYMDCEGTPMYVSREIGNQLGDVRNQASTYEIFNHLGQLVATGAPSDVMQPGQLYFKDDAGVAFALAGNPTAAQVATGKVEWLPQRSSYDFDHWQVWFMEGFNSVTYLKEPDHRWVIAAVIQEHAILNTLVPDRLTQTHSNPTQYLVFLGLIVGLCVGAASLCLMSCGSIFYMVYPPKKVFKGNPFMTDDIGGNPYGSMRA